MYITSLTIYILYYIVNNTSNPSSSSNHQCYILGKQQNDASNFENKNILVTEVISSSVDQPPPH